MNNKTLFFSDTCITEETTENPKFFPMLEFADSTNEVIFEVQEINLYRRLAHLSLRLKRGNDAKVRQHLGDCLKQLRHEHSLTLEKLEESEQALQELGAEKSRILSDFQAQSQEFVERDALYKNKLASEINEEREKAAKLVAELRLSYDSERRRLVEDHAATLRTLENRVAALDYDNRDLAEKKHKNEATIQRLKDEHKNVQEECKRLRGEVDQYRQDKENLGQGNHELDRNLNRLQAHCQVLETEKVRLAADLKRRDDTIEDLMTMRKNLETEIQEKKTLVTKRETAVKNVSQELIKANEVIRKLQDQNRKENHKIKLGCQIVQEQEKHLADKENELENTRKQLKDKTEESNHKEEELETLKNQLEATKNESDELNKKLKTNENVIQWLNKQLTTAQARDPGLRLGPPPPGIINFSASGMASTSTPMPLKENKKPGLDPKYLQPSPNLAGNHQRPVTSRNKAGAGGLLRKNLSSASSPALAAAANNSPPQSVYFAKT